MIIGKNTETGNDVKINLESLIATRLLLQANSGGGKSWALRKILEESHGKVQQIIIDLEGEFSTLREKYDYLLCSSDGDISISIKTADLLARKLLDLRVSSILDLSELKKHERVLFVKRFLDSLVESPKKLWHSCLVVIDEAQDFCPQSSKSESAGSVIDLMTRGRKRGFCGILATQRISKLHKDACAECNNRIIGRTGLDLDRKRASEELGFTSKSDELSLRNLGQGEFFCFGTSISNKIIKLKIGDVKTTHPDRTKGIVAKPSKTPKNIKTVLKGLIDLPKEAEKELKTKQDMLKKINELKRENRVLKFSKKEKKEFKTDERLIDKAKENGYNLCKKEMSNDILSFKKEINLLTDRIKKISELSNIQKSERKIFNLEKFKEVKTIKKPVILNIKRKDGGISKIKANKIVEDFSGNNKINAGAYKILGWLAGVFPDGLTKQRVATLSGYSYKSGTFSNYLSNLRRNGWIEGNNNKLRATQEGFDNAKNIPEIPTGEELINMWGSKLSKGAGKLLRVICNEYPESVSKEELGDETGYSFTSGTFSNYLSILRRNNLIKTEGSNIFASSEFFE